MKRLIKFAAMVVVALAAIGAVMPVVLGTLQDRGVALTDAMTVAMVCSGLLAAGIIWLGPETRGRQFTSADAA